MPSDIVNAVLERVPGRLIAVVGLLAAYKVYYKLTTGRCHSNRRLDGLTAIVTGGNSGIGKETARDLASRGARVILACRDVSKAERVKEDIIRTTGNKNVVVRSLDLSRFASVREFAKIIEETEPALHILINNAGMPGNPNKKSKDGIDLIVQVNHLGHVLLTLLLLDLMKRSAPGRIVFVSSVLHQTARLDVNDLGHEKLVPYSTVIAYSNTKLCNILTANYLANVLKDTGITVNSLHPGAVLTSIWDKLPKVPAAIIKAIISTFMKNEEEGAQTTIYVAVSEDLEGVTGKYFSDCKEKRASAAARDPELARVVFERSCSLIGIPIPAVASRL